jgi:hypothetical protein
MIGGHPSRQRNDFHSFRESVIARRVCVDARRDSAIVVPVLKCASLQVSAHHQEKVKCV